MYTGVWYQLVEGQQTVSFWSPLDPVTDATLRCVAGSHAWEKPVLPTRWAKGDAFFDPAPYMPVPDPDAEGMDIREWAMEPGDAVAFSFRTLHGAPANASTTRRRVISVRWVGDDARFADRPGKTSPAFPDLEYTPGDPFSADEFPVLYNGR